MGERFSPTKVLYAIDRRITGRYQVPAEQFEQLTDDSREARKLARGRIAIAAGASMDIVGRGVATLGLAQESHPTIFALGTLLAVGGAIAQKRFMQVNGTRWSVNLQEKLNSLGPFKRAVEATLVDNGITDEEIGGLPTFYRDVHSAEVANPNLARLKNTLTPVSSGFGMAASGEYIVAALIAGLGVSSWPLGEQFYKSANVVRLAKIRVAQTASHIPYLRKMYKEHTSMSTKIEAIAATPDVAFASFFLTSGGNNALPALYGLKEGLLGLSNVLVSQRERERAHRTTEIAGHLIEALSNKPFIATSQRWKEHIAESGVTVYEDVPFQNGISIKDFVSQSPDGEKTNLAPLSVDVPTNGAAILRAKSGKGKSVTFMGLMHLFEHTGSVHLIKDGKTQDVHTHAGPREIAQEILFITEDGVHDTDRLTDLFKEYFREQHQNLYEVHKKKHSLFEHKVELAWATADNLLEKEIANLENSETSAFPPTMLTDLKDMREQRKEWVNMHLESQGGNIAELKANRVFETLSSGEKRRLLIAVADVASQVRKRTAIILDEPLANLDDENKELQLKTLARMQRENSVALLIASHDNIRDLMDGLNDCQLVSLERTE